MFQANNSEHDTTISSLSGRVYFLQTKQRPKQGIKSYAFKSSPADLWLTIHQSQTWGLKS